MLIDPCFYSIIAVVLMQRWIKQVEDECCSASVDGTESTSSQQSTSSRSTPNPLSSGMYISASVLKMYLLLYLQCL